MNFWNLISPNVILALAFVPLVGGIALLIGAGTGYAIVVSALFVLAGVFINTSVKFHSDMRERAIAFIDKSKTDTKLFSSFKGLRNLGTYCLLYDLDPAEIARRCFRQGAKPFVHARGGTIDPDQILEDFYRVGNFYEQVHLAVSCRDANEHILFEYYGGVFIRHYRILSAFLPQARNTGRSQDHPLGPIAALEMYTGIETLFKRWHPRYLRAYGTRRRPGNGDGDGSEGGGGAVNSGSWTGADRPLKCPSDP